MLNINTVVFDNYNEATVGNSIWQYDYGQILRIQGLKLPPAVEVHFSLKLSGDAVTRIGVTRDGVTEVPIPDSMLENGNIDSNYTMYAYIYITDDVSGQTEYKITAYVKTRPKPEAFERPEDAELFREAIAAVNEYAERAEASKQGAAEAEESARQIASGIRDDVAEMVGEANAARNTAVEHANIAVNKAEETESDKESTESIKAAVEALKQATDDNLKQSEWYLQEQASMLGKVPMIYAAVTLEELQAVPSAKEGDFGIIQEPNMMLFRYVTHNVSGNEIVPAWAWMTDLNISFNRESMLHILSLADIATSGSYADLKNIPNRYNVPLVLDSSGDSVTWDYSMSDTAVVTLTDTKPLLITGAYNGAVAVIQCYGGMLDFSDTVYNKSATFAYLEPLEAEHITYTLIYNAGKWDVTALVYSGGDAGD